MSFVHKKKHIRLTLTQHAHSHIEYKRICLPNNWNLFVCSCGGSVLIPSSEYAQRRVEHQTQLWERQKKKTSTSTHKDREREREREHQQRDQLKHVQNCVA